jgi:hypothetical protein
VEREINKNTKAIRLQITADILFAIIAFRDFVAFLYSTTYVSSSSSSTSVISSSCMFALFFGKNVEAFIWRENEDCAGVYSNMRNNK